MKFLRMLCVVAVALCLTASVYAETQSVKVSGDLTMRALLRDQYGYAAHPDEAQTRVGIDGPTQDWLMSVAAVQVDADLTDNVRTVVRILNQRDWNVYGKAVTSTTTLAPNGRGGYIENTDEFNVMLDLAYVQLKDFIYAPLSLTIGRQNLWFGKGFIVGANQQNPSNNLSAPEYTAINSFDSVKAVLDYDPWAVTGIYSKIYGDAVQSQDDVNLYGVNVGYKFNSYNAEAEGYWFYKQDNMVDHWNWTKSNNDVYTLGARASLDPINLITIAGEVAWQGGSYLNSHIQQASRSRSAWALDVSGEVRYFTDKHAWKPKLGAEYIYYSGDKNETYGNQNSNSTYTGWDPMYRGKFDSAIREFVGKFYQSARYPTNGSVTQSSADDSRTNQHQVVLMGSVQPMDSLTLKANLNFFWNQYQWTTDQKSGGWIGEELDLNVNWDYTEDVSFGILAGWFLPNETYYQGLDKVATDIVGTVKVSF